MKIIEALKKTKDLARRHEDLVKKINQYSADMDMEAPTYPDQRKQVSDWRQAAIDTNKEYLRLKTAIAYTNATTFVTIELGGKHVSHTITGWILRRKELAKRDQMIWGAHTNRNLQSGRYQRTDGSFQEVKPRLYFDPAERDAKIEEYASEPSLIDARLEVVNATTDLVEEIPNERRV